MTKPLEKDCAVHAEKLKTMKEDIGEIKFDVKELHDMMCKNGFHGKFIQTNLRTKINTWLIAIMMTGVAGLAVRIILSGIK